MSALKDIYEIIKDAIDSTTKVRELKKAELEIDKLKREVKKLDREELERNYIVLATSVHEIQQYDPRTSSLIETVKQFEINRRGQIAKKKAPKVRNARASFGKLKKTNVHSWQRKPRKKKSLKSKR